MEEVRMKREALFVEALKIFCSSLENVLIYGQEEEEEQEEEGGRWDEDRRREEPAFEDRRVDEPDFEGILRSDRQIFLL